MVILDTEKDPHSLAGELNVGKDHEEVDRVNADVAGSIVGDC